MILVAVLADVRWACAGDILFYQPPNDVLEPFPSTLDQLVISAALLVLAIVLAVAAVAQLRSVR